MILIIKHIDIEGPGTLGVFLKRNRVDCLTVDIGKGEKLPASLSGIGGIVSLGGPMNVYEEDVYPFLKAEEQLLKSAIENNLPVLGICLGAQLLAKALGAKVKKSPQKEIGWSKVKLTKGAFRDNLFEGLDRHLEVFQWHEDMFDLPENSVLLAESSACPHQAFRAGQNIYGLQFHLEIDKQMINSWSVRYNQRHHRIDYLFDFFSKKSSLEKQARTIYKNFLKLIDKSPMG